MNMKGKPIKTENVLEINKTNKEKKSREEQNIYKEDKMYDENKTATFFAITQITMTTADCACCCFHVHCC